MTTKEAAHDLFQLVIDLRKRVTELEGAISHLAGSVGVLADRVNTHLTPQFTACDEDEEPGEED